MTINYKIEMLSDWHVGSGLDSGSDADAIVLKDKDNLPYIPGKTIKGLLKDALNEISKIQGSFVKKKQLNSEFGYISEIIIEGEDISGKTSPGNAYFSNAEVGKKERKEIAHQNLSGFLYRNIASTAIEDNGVAKKNSLRLMQVCIPITLYGNISEISDKELFVKAFKWLRHLGINRNRGLGRCKFSIIENSENQVL